MINLDDIESLRQEHESNTGELAVSVFPFTQALAQNIKEHDLWAAG